MAARAIWKGIIEFGAVSAPVKLYSAVEDRDVHFHLLHDQDMTRLKQRMVNPQSGEEVARDQTRKGVAVEPGRYVVLTEQETEQLKPEASRTISIEQFVEPQQINHQWYDRPYYLGPDEDGEDAYWALAAALKEQNKEGVARWTMRNKQYVGALRLHEGYLMLVTLRHAEEIIDASQIKLPGGRKLDVKELKLSQQLVSALEDEFNPTEFNDDYRARVLDLIERKAKGKKIELPKPVEKKPTQKSLSDVLEASLKAVKGRKKEPAHA